MQIPLQGLLRPSESLQLLFGMLASVRMRFAGRRPLSAECFFSGSDNGVLFLDSHN